jgi:hypothetical protein
VIRVVFARDVFRRRAAAVGVAELIADGPHCFEKRGIKRRIKPIVAADTNECLAGRSVFVEFPALAVANRLHDALEGSADVSDRIRVFTSSISLMTVHHFNTSGLQSWMGQSIQTGEHNISVKHFIILADKLR